MITIEQARKVTKLKFEQGWYPFATDEELEMHARKLVADGELVENAILENYDKGTLSTELTETAKQIKAERNAEKT